MQVVFNRPLKLTSKNFPKGKSFPASKRPVEVEDELLSSDFVKGCQKEGYLVISAAAPQAAASPAAPKK